MKSIRPFNNIINSLTLIWKYSILSEPKEVEFVLVEKANLPSHDSAEVQEALPKHITGNSQQQQSGEVSQANPSGLQNNTIENSSQSSSAMATPNLVKADPLFRRKFLSAPEYIGKNCPNPERQFTIASYNILADCHAIRGHKQWQQYKWITQDKLAIEHRQIRLHQEYWYLDADILCLQEVSPSYYHDVLLPLMKRFVFFLCYCLKNDE